jgi:hypothetical protein
MIYGANGYTGELIAREAVSRGLKPMLAGRTAAKVEPLAASLDLEVRVFDLRDVAATARNVEGTALVLHCAGPFSATAAQMIAACLAAHAHYLDITGEISVFEHARTLDAIEILGLVPVRCSLRAIFSCWKAGAALNFSIRSSVQTCNLRFGQHMSQSLVCAPCVRASRWRSLQGASIHLIRMADFGDCVKADFNLMPAITSGDHRIFQVIGMYEVRNKQITEIIEAWLTPREPVEPVEPEPVDA